jgi:site-specific DNA-methyltransferase (adenine-specific)/adenine-specific DNA-methyltransferase
MQKIIDAGLIIWPDEMGGGMKRPRYKTYYDPKSLKPKPVSSWIETATVSDKTTAEAEEDLDLTILSTGMNQEGGRLMQQLMGTKVFAYPKPLSLIRSLVRATAKGNDLVMDSFAGTGTTGHAVLEQNAEDEQARRFILIEMEQEICQKITSERLRRIVLGYQYESSGGKKKQVEGLGGGFRYCVLGEPLFDETGQIRSDVRFADLARHVFFTETGEPLPKTTNGKKSPLVGVCNGTAYYLLFNGIMGDKRPNGGNVLTSKLLTDLPPHDGPRIVYGEGCRLSAARLKRERIVFKQIPYGIKVN